MSDEFRKGLEAQSASMHEFKDAPSAASTTECRFWWGADHTPCAGCGKAPWEHPGYASVDRWEPTAACKCDHPRRAHDTTHSETFGLQAGGCKAFLLHDGWAEPCTCGQFWPEETK